MIVGVTGSRDWMYHPVHECSENSGNTGERVP
jgi:hypothetical protein